MKLTSGGSATAILPPLAALAAFLGSSGRIAAASEDAPPSGLSRHEWAQMRQAIQESSYGASRVAEPTGETSLKATNAQQGYGITFWSAGIEMAPEPGRGGSWRLRLSLVGYGYAGEVRPLPAAEPDARRDRVEYRRGRLREWYVNGPGGLEQGFELDEPGDRRDEPLVVTMSVAGDLEPASDGTAIRFSDSTGAEQLRYAGLKAWDAAGKPLRCRAEAEGRALHLVLEAQQARFPITVDPVFVHEAELFGHVDPIGASFATQVSVSGDTAIVGGREGVNGSQGAAYVFIRSGTTWSLQQQLLASDEIPGDGFGSAVSISGDAVVVGNSGASAAAYVFVRVGTTWSEQQKLTASDGLPNDGFASAVAVSGDTAVVSGSGAVYVFVRSGSMWAEAQKLTAPVPFSGFGGSSVDLSGGTILVGAPSEPITTSLVGAAYVFVRSGGIWTQQQRLLDPSPAVFDRFGWSVSISGDTAVLGVYPAGGHGRAEVFTRTGTSWTEQQALSAPDGGLEDGFGFNVALSGDIAIVGAIGRDAAYVFARAGSLWTGQQKIPLAVDGPDSVAVSGNTALVDASGRAFVFVGSGPSWNEEKELTIPEADLHDEFGRSVAVSGDTAVVGAPYDDTAAGVDAGSAYVLVRSGLAWVEQQKLTLSYPAPAANFGRSIAISGDTLIVAAPYESAQEGRVHVYVRQGATWSEQQVIAPPPPPPTTHTYNFGTAVSLSGDTAAISTPYVNAIGPDSGVDIYVRAGTTWSLQQELLGCCLTYFGQALSLSDDTLLVGNVGVFGSSADVLVRSGGTWSTEQELLGSDTVPADNLGISVSLSGDTAVVGTSTEKAYVFVRSGSSWAEQQKLTASDGVAGDQFGGSVAISGDTVIVAASLDDTASGTDAGSAYVFTRSGTIWSEQPKLTAPNAAAGDSFASSVALWGDTAVVGKPGNTSSAHVFRSVEADLGIAKDDGQTAATPGQPITYSIVVSNAGPSNLPSAQVTDQLPAGLVGGNWSCGATAGSSCGDGGSGSLSDTAALLAGGSATYTLTATVDAAAMGTLVNTATVASPAGVDPNSANDAATDADTLVPLTDLGVTKTDGVTSAVAGQALSYTITATNAGPSVAAGAAVTDAVPAGLQGATWTCSASPGSSCAASGSGGISDTVTALVGGSVSYTLTGTVDPAAALELVNTASVAPAAGASDPAMENNSATDVDALPVGFPVAGELGHGYDHQHDLAALPGPVAAEDVFRIYQKPHASYEVLVDGVSADLSAGDGPLVERVASDVSTVLQSSAPAGAGGSRSLRWMNALDHSVAEEFVRVMSAGCSTDCDTNDVYRLKVRETTGFISRFNNSGTQITVLVLENSGDSALDVDVRFWSQTGSSLGGSLASLGPRQTYILNTSTIAPGSGGSLTLANTGRYGQLSGKAVAVEPSTGFTFDTGVLLRPR